MTEVHEWWAEPETAEPPIQVRHRVTAILVNRNGRTWLSESLRGLREQTRPADLVIAVDLGSDDGSERLLEVAGEGVHLIRLAADAGLAAAVAAAEDLAPLAPDEIEWLWLLHDDSCPDPDALEQLLATADSEPSASVLGGKIVGWRDPGHVLEVGVAYTAIGSRFTGLERGERDQGQHDRVHEVMAVSGAGMMVRRQMWRSLGGFTAELDHFRIDTEFCMRVWENGGHVFTAPAARIRHVAATARGLRGVEGHRGSSHFLDRFAGLTLSLSRTPRNWLFARWLLIGIAGVVRAAGYLALQDVIGARDEISASVAALLSRRRVLTLRKQRGEIPVPERLRPGFRPQLSHLSTELVDTLGRAWQTVLNWLLPGRAHIEDVGVRQALWAAVRRPGAVLSLFTLLAGVVLAQPVLGDGALQLFNGEVVPNERFQLLSDYLAGWHSVGFGSTLAANPVQGLVGLAAVVAGSAAVFVKWTLVLGIWMVAVSMHLALRRALVHAPTRVWFSALYAFSPPVLIAVVTGDVGTLWAAVLLPQLAVLAPRLRNSWRAVAVAGAIGALLFAVWPITWLVMLIFVIVAAWLQPIDRSVLRHWLMVPAWSLLLTMPWSIDTLLRPARWLVQFGSAQEGIAPAAAALLGVPDLRYGFGWWWSAALLAVAAGAWIDRRNRNTQLAIWRMLAVITAVALVGQVLAVVLRDGRLQPTLTLASVISIGLMVASLASVSGFVRVKLARAEFGRRQVLAFLSAVAITLMPIASFVSAIRVPVETRAHLSPERSTEMLRGFTEDLRLRTLMLSSGDGEIVLAELLDGRPRSFGDLAVADSTNESEISAAVGNWLTLTATDTGNPLQRFGIGYVAVPFGDPIADRVAAHGGLQRLLTARNENLLSVWRVSDVAARAYFGAGTDADHVLRTVASPPNAPSVTGFLLPQPDSTDIVLADRNVSGWSLTLNGKVISPEPSVELRWRVPAGENGRVVIDFAAMDRSGAVSVSLAALIAVLLILLPKRRHAYQDEWLDEHDGQ